MHVSTMSRVVPGMLETIAASLFAKYVNDNDYSYINTVFSVLPIR